MASESGAQQGGGCSGPPPQGQAPAGSGGGTGPPGGGGGPPGGPPRGGGAPPPQQQQQQQPPPPAVPQASTGALKGRAADIFTGIRGTVETFLQKFNTFRNANHSNEIMVIPFQRANLLLTLMSGPKVDKWAANRGELLSMAVLRDPGNNVAPITLETNEHLWTHLTLALKNAYSPYHGVESAFRDIMALKQQPGRVDDYIVEFDNLLSKTEWRRDDHGTIETFKEGLILALLTDCLKQRPPPATLAEWFHAARDEEQSYYTLQHSLGMAKRRRGHLQDLAQDTRRGRKSGKPQSDIDPHPYDPMQLDAAKAKRLSEEERKRLQSKGKCFNCKKMGHMYRECPTKPKPKGKGKARAPPGCPRPHTRAADTSSSVKDGEDADSEGSKDDPPAYTTKDMKVAIKAMTTEEREEFLDTMALETDEQDF